MWDSAEGTSAARSVSLNTDGQKQNKATTNAMQNFNGAPLQAATTEKKFFLLNFPDCVRTSCAHLSFRGFPHTSHQDADLCVSHAKTYDGYRIAAICDYSLLLSVIS